MKTNGVSIVAFSLSRLGRVSDILLIVIESMEENNSPVVPTVDPHDMIS